MRCVVLILRSFEIEKDAFLQLLTFSASVQLDETIEQVEQRPRAGERTETMVEILPGPFKYGKKPENTNIDKESGIGKTTRVDRYANGVSPAGCYDMAGNVWEWTAGFFDDDRDTYTIKGGAWDDPADRAACAYRSFHDYPDFRSYDVGFRCARTKT